MKNNDRESIDLALLIMEGMAPVVSCLNGFIILAQDNKDFKSKCKKIIEGDNVGFYSVTNLLNEWDSFKKANYWESEAIDVDKILIERFQKILQNRERDGEREGYR